MTVAPKRGVPRELIDGLLADYKRPEDLIGENGLLKELTKMLVERALDAEMAEQHQTPPPPQAHWPPRRTNHPQHISASR